jgi:hypothetical protein
MEKGLLHGESVEDKVENLRSTRVNTAAIPLLMQNILIRLGKLSQTSVPRARKWSITVQAQGHYQALRNFDVRLHDGRVPVQVLH